MYIKFADIISVITSQFNLTKNWNPSIALFISVFDFGAPFRYRIDSDKPLPSDINFKQLFSPGVFIRFPEISPLHQIKILAGIQILPQVNNIDESGNAIEQTGDRKRFGVYLTYDIPLFFF